MFREGRKHGQRPPKALGLAGVVSPVFARVQRVWRLQDVCRGGQNVCRTLQAFDLGILGARYAALGTSLPIVPILAVGSVIALPIYEPSIHPTHRWLSGAIAQRESRDMSMIFSLRVKPSRSKARRLSAEAPGWRSRHLAAALGTRRRLLLGGATRIGDRDRCGQLSHADSSLSASGIT
jgi:hypothetical protein